MQRCPSPPKHRILGLLINRRYKEGELTSSTRDQNPVSRLGVRLFDGFPDLHCGQPSEVTMTINYDVL